MQLILKHIYLAKDLGKLQNYKTIMHLEKTALFLFLLYVYMFFLVPLRWINKGASSLILSYLILPYLILPYLILPYLILPNLILPYLILPYLILPYLILSYLILSYLISSYLISFYLISSYLISFYLISSYLISFYLISSYLISSYLISSFLCHAEKKCSRCASTQKMSAVISLNSTILVIALLFQSFV